MSHSQLSLILTSSVMFLSACSHKPRVWVQACDYILTPVGPSDQAQYATARTPESLQEALAKCGIKTMPPLFEGLTFDQNEVAVISKRAIVAEIRSSGGYDFILLEPKLEPGIGFSIIAGKTDRVGKFTWK